jgi:DNA processing protein
MTDQNLLYQIGITLIKGIGNITARQIIDSIEDVSLLFTEKKHILERLPGVSRRIIAEIRNPSALKRAEKELHFIEQKRITPLFIRNDAYPRRLKECVDAPVMLYYKGNANLNSDKIVSVVGTRNATPYGREITDNLLIGLAEKFPNLLVVSGLAYGIDVVAHRAAIRNSLPTVGVLAHGLDRIYPFDHRDIAAAMLDKGGILSDFLSETNPDRQNFVKRNRIIAGLADCTIVAESATKGGALITANIADSYNRDIFAFPGRTADRYSAGCNMLIKQRKAALITSAEDLITEMNWNEDRNKTKNSAVQRKLFLTLNEDEQTVANILSKTGNMQLNILAVESNMPVSKLSNLLFELEMKAVVKCRPGGIYEINSLF